MIEALTQVALRDETIALRLLDLKKVKKEVRTQADERRQTREGGARPDMARPSSLL